MHKLFLRGLNQMFQRITSPAAPISPVEEERSPARSQEYRLSTRVETITPDRAAEMLETGYAVKNRRVNAEYVRNYARDMADGQWVLNGEAIKFNRQGQLIDGQHRLYAVIESGATIQSLVVYGLTEDAFEAMDDPRKRNASQYLERLGYTQTASLAAVIRFILRYQRLGDFRQLRMTDGRIRWAEYGAFREAHPQLDDAVRRGRRAGLRPLAATPSLLSALYFLFADIDQEDADGFFDLLESGVGLQDGDPILTLRNHLLSLKQQMRGGQAESNYVAAVIIKAWNAWRKGEPLHVLRFKTGGAKPERFPEIQ